MKTDNWKKMKSEENLAAQLCELQHQMVLSAAAPIV